MKQICDNSGLTIKYDYQDTIHSIIITWNIQIFFRIDYRNLYSIVCSGIKTEKNIRMNPTHSLTAESCFNSRFAIFHSNSFLRIYFKSEILKENSLFRISHCRISRCNSCFLTGRRGRICWTSFRCPKSHNSWTWRSGGIFYMDDGARRRNFTSRFDAIHSINKTE